MRILMVFSAYRQPGGEERSTDTESELLRSDGHVVDVLRITSPVRAGSELREAIERCRPDVVHVQNFFPALRPQHFRHIRESGRPIVQSIRNYRLTCVSANHWRDDRTCAECTFDRHRQGVVHGCYRGRRTQSLVATGLLNSHRIRGTWSDAVSVFIAVSEHIRDTIEPMVGATPVVVKPNTVLTDLEGDGSLGDVVYVGRIASEKGIVDTAQVWASEPTLPMLTVLGDGPQSGQIEQIARRALNVQALGPVSHDLALDRMGTALASITPWRWDEPFGRSLMESVAVGTPVIASHRAAQRFPADVGAVRVTDTTSSSDLLAAVDGLRRDPAGRAAATDYFGRHFSPSRNLDILVGAYEAAMGRDRSRGGEP